MNGKTGKRISFYTAYAKTAVEKKLVKQQMNIAAKENRLIHIGGHKGAFWVIASLPQNMLKKWGNILKKTINVALYPLAFVLGTEHPEWKDLLTHLNKLFPK